MILTIETFTLKDGNLEVILEILQCVKDADAKVILKLNSNGNK